MCGSDCAAARRTYEEAKSAGYSTALVEQHKPNIFAQSIANIAPHETVKVKLTYVDLLQHRDNAYELVVPLVVGPRYQPAEDSSNPTPQIDYVHPMRASSTVSFTATIDAGLPIRGITSPSHRLAVRDIAPTRAEVMLAETGEIPNRDLVIRFATADQQTQAGVPAPRPGRRRRRGT
jgi:Ca-activated chloride channel family protein